jgi:hypothetical protein
MIDYGIATALAIALVASLLSIFSAVGANQQRRMFRLFTTCRCPSCGDGYSLETVSNGLETSPFEELWSDGVNHTIHCHPQCRCVVCGHCGHLAEIRYNSQGEFFGPMLSIKDVPESVSFGQDGCPRWDVGQLDSSASVFQLRAEHR